MSIMDELRKKRMPSFKPEDILASLAPRAAGSKNHDDIFDRTGDGLQEAAARLGFGTTASDKRAQEALERARRGWEEFELPSLTRESPIRQEAYDIAPSEYQKISVDPVNKQIQMEQLAALRNLAANGGRDAASDADLARIQQTENANARGQRDAIVQNANARGVGGSGAELLAQLSSSQNATNNQSARDMDVRGQNQQQALRAAMAAANVGQNLHNNDYQQQADKARSQDAINRFNAAQRTDVNAANARALSQAQQFNTNLQQREHENRYNKQNAISGGHVDNYNHQSHKADREVKQAGELVGGAIKLGSGAMAAARGGRIPGTAAVPGDDYLNDYVPITASPGEVVVPRSVVNSSPQEIANFVQNPPEVKSKEDELRDYLMAKYNKASDTGGLNLAHKETARVNNIANTGHALESMFKSASVARGGPGVDAGYYQGLKGDAQRAVGQASDMRAIKVQDELKKAEIGFKVAEEIRQRGNHDEKMRAAKVAAEYDQPGTRPSLHLAQALGSLDRFKKSGIDLTQFTANELMEASKSMEGFARLEDAAKAREHEAGIRQMEREKEQRRYDQNAFRDAYQDAINPKNPAAKQAMDEAHNAGKALRLVKKSEDFEAAKRNKSKIAPEDVFTLQDFNLLIEEVAKLARGGVPTEAGHKNLSAATFEADLSKFMTKWDNKPSDAAVADFVQSHKKYILDILDNARKTFTNNLEGNFEANKPKLMPDYQRLYQEGTAKFATKGFIPESEQKTVQPLPPKDRPFFQEDETGKEVPYMWNEELQDYKEVK